MKLGLMRILESERYSALSLDLKTDLKPKERTENTMLKRDVPLGNYRKKVMEVKDI